METLVKQRRRDPVARFSVPTLAEQEEVQVLRCAVYHQQHHTKEIEEKLAKAQQLLEDRDCELKDAIAATQDLKLRCCLD